MSANPQKLLVTAKIGDSSRRWVWDANEPMGLGHPFRWVFERTENGIRVRDISRTVNQLRINSFREVSNEVLTGEGGEARFQNVTFHFKPMKGLKPAFEPEALDHFDSVTAFCTIGDWLLNADPLGERFVGRLNGETLFTITQSGNNGSSIYQLVAKSASVTTAAGSLAAGSVTELTSQQLRALTLRSGEYSWRFGASAKSSISQIAPKLSPEAQAEETVFRKALGGTGIAVALLLSLSWVSSMIWPKGNTADELIPPQYASVVMSKQPQGGSAPAASESARENVAKAESSAKSSAVPDKVQKAAVVQAFRATALQNAVSGLLKGGMTKLMQDSDFVSGKSAREAHKIFDTASNSLGSTGELTGQGKNVKIGAIGGEGASGSAGGGKGVGYGKGEHAGVTGQGKSFVSLDIGNSSVEEGLTKDEVGEVIHRHLSEVRYCYESAMLRNTDLEGKLVLNFTIGATGAVKSSEIKSSTLPDPRLDDCVVRRLVTWQFPKTKGGIDVAVSYPFIFKTLGR